MNLKTREAIQLLSVHHKEFIKAAKAIAGNNSDVRNYAEDFVQEAYIKLSRYEDLYEKIVKDGKASKGYMFFALRSIIINSIKKKSNLNYSHVGDEYDFEEKFMLEDKGLDPHFEALNKIEGKMFEVLKKGVSWFDYELFRKYVTTGKSFQTIANESGLGVQTIYLSIKKCKLCIADALFEDYVKFNKGQYDEL